MTTYEGRGFLKWDATRSADPPGETDVPTLLGDLEKLVLGVGEQGCGFEAPLETMYRFLSDPEPEASIELRRVDSVRNA